MSSTLENITALPAVKDIAALSDAEQFDLFMTTTQSDEIPHAARLHINQALRIPVAVKRYEDQIIDQIQDFFWDEPEHPWVKAYRQARIKKNMTPEQRLEFARSYVEMLTYFFHLPYAPDVTTAKMKKTYAAVYQTQDLIPAGCICYNIHRKADTLTGSFSNFLYYTGHEFGHAFSRFLVLQVSEAARRALTSDHKSHIPFMSSQSELFKGALLFSFNQYGGHKRSFYYHPDDENAELAKGYRDQIEEKHARDFAYRLDDRLGAVVEIMDVLDKPADFMRLAWENCVYFKNNIEIVIELARAKRGSTQDLICMPADIGRYEERLRKVLQPSAVLDFRAVRQIFRDTASLVVYHQSSLEDGVVDGGLDKSLRGSAETLIWLNRAMTDVERVCGSFCRLPADFASVAQLQSNVDFFKIIKGAMDAIDAQEIRREITPIPL